MLENMKQPPDLLFDLSLALEVNVDISRINRMIRQFYRDLNTIAWAVDPFGRSTSGQRSRTAEHQYFTGASLCNQSEGGMNRRGAWAATIGESGTCGAETGRATSPAAARFLRRNARRKWRSAGRFARKRSTGEAVTKNRDQVCLTPFKFLSQRTICGFAAGHGGPLLTRGGAVR